MIGFLTSPFLFITIVLEAGLLVYLILGISLVTIGKKEANTVKIKSGWRMIYIYPLIAISIWMMYRIVIWVLFSDLGSGGFSIY